MSPDTPDNDNNSPIDLARSKQLNYCLRVFAAHLTTAAQPNHKPPIKPSSSNHNISLEKTSSAPTKIRPPLSETPQFVPKPPPHRPGEYKGLNSLPSRLVQSTDQMDATPITTLHPTPPPPEKRNNRTSRRFAARRFNQAVSNENLQNTSEPRPMEKTNDYVYQQQVEQRVPSMPRKRFEAAQAQLEHQSSVDQDEGMDVVENTDHYPYPQQQIQEDVTVGVAPLTKEALANQQRAFQMGNNHVKFDDRTNSAKSRESQSTVIHRQETVVEEGGGDDSISAQSISAERADDDTSSHDSTADTVVHSPSKHRGHHHHRHPLGPDATPRTFLGSAKHPSRDDMNADDSTPPPPKMSILSGSPPPLFNPPRNQHHQSQWLGSQSLNDPLTQTPTQHPWSHLPPVNSPNRPLPIPPSMEDEPVIPNNVVKARHVTSSKSKKHKSKKSQHLQQLQQQQNIIYPVQPLFPVQPLKPSVVTPPPPQPSPSMIPNADYYQHSNLQKQNSLARSDSIGSRQRTGSFGRRNVESNTFDQMESDNMELSPQAGVGFVAPPNLAQVPANSSHRPPSRRGNDVQDRESAIVEQHRGSNNNTPILSRRSRQNAPILPHSPSPSGSPAPSKQPQVKN